MEEKKAIIELIFFG